MLKLNLNFKNQLKTSNHFAGKVLKKNNAKDHFVVDGKLIILKETLSDFKEGEIWLVFPDEKKINRFFRPYSNSNTILLTERCDQLCIMCSQPPKSKDYDHFELYLDAIKKIEDNTFIGITGGEPTLFGDQLFDFIIQAVNYNKNIIFHILTNGQHFKQKDIQKLKIIRNNVIWAVPIYSSNANTHNQIVGKQNAFESLIPSINNLFLSGSKVELRTVILKQNQHDLLNLSKFVNNNFQWIQFWSLMQLEKFGYAKIDWETKFLDTSIDFEIIENLILMCEAGGINIFLYNFPHCTVPQNLRRYCNKSISDWKQKYLSICNACSIKKDCCGFFEWYNEKDGFKMIRPI